MMTASSRAEEAEVIVRGERQGGSFRDPTAASTVVSGEALRSPGASSADVLERVPGVRVSRTGASSALSTAGIRGASSAQTPVYVAGVRINDDLTGVADLSTIPLWMIERVEVFRGNAPVDADQLGIGGAVFFEPRRPAQTQAGAGAEVGSFGANGQWLSFSGVGERNAALVAARRASAENDYEFSLGGDSDERDTRHNADFTDYDLWAIGRHDLGDGARITTVFNGFEREQGVPGLGVLQTRRARARSRRLLGGLTAKVPCGRTDGAESCSLELTSSAVLSRTRLDDPLRELIATAIRSDSDGERFSQRGRLKLAVGEDLDVGVVLHGAVERLSVDQDSAAPIVARRLFLTPGVNALWALSRRVDLHAVAAAECHSTESLEQSASCDVFEPVGRLGARVRVWPWLSLRANVGRYLRVPTLGELFGVSAVVRGNDELDPESGLSADLGGAATFGGTERFRGALEAFVFERRAEDLIAYRRNVVAGAIQPYNVGKARFRGAEALLFADALRALRGELALTLLDARDLEPVVPNDLLPFRPRLTAGGRLETYRESLGSVVDRASLAANVVYTSSQYADQAGLVVIAEQLTVDLELAARMLNGVLALRAAARNVFGVTQYDAVGLPLPGRSFYASAEVWW